MKNPLNGLTGRPVSITLSQFVRGLVKALTDGQQGIPDAREEQLQHHMTTGEDGVMSPESHRVKLSDDEFIDLPTYSFCQVNTIGIKSAKVQCNARIVGLAPNESTSGTMTTGDEEAVFRVTPGNGGKNTITMVIEFESRNPSETEMHLIESLDRQSVVSESLSKSGDTGDIIDDIPPSN